MTVLSDASVLFRYQTAGIDVYRLRDRANLHPRISIRFRFISPPFSVISIHVVVVQSRRAQSATYNPPE